MRKGESMGGGTKKLKPIVTASESIDSMPPSAQRGNDMLSEACSCLRRDDIAVEACIYLEREGQAEGREDGQLARNLAGDQVDVKHVVAVVDVGHAEVSLQ